MINVLKLNEISPVAEPIFDNKYDFSKNVENPVGIMVRSAKMADYAVGSNLIAVARAGAGVNNIPVEKYTEKGIVVFNTPGANANAVKELVICAMLLASRKIPESIDWCKTIKGKGEDVPKLVENGKNAFVGPELFGKKLGVIGLGAIGAMVANAACELGMSVLGYDPFISIDAAWGLSRNVKHITDLNQIIAESDYITIHTPLTSGTKELIDAAKIAKMKNGVKIINCSRGELVSNLAILEALNSGKVSTYFTDFPTDDLIGVENVICVPHLGASTPEAEDNCAYAAAKQLKDYIENGNIFNSVNYPNCVVARSGIARIAITHKNIKGTLSQFTSLIGENNINIANMTNQSKGDFAYTMFDLDSDVDSSIKAKFEAVEGVSRVRIIR